MQYEQYGQYIYPKTITELIEARKKGFKIELNGTAINGGYGETWNEYTNEDFLWDASVYRIIDPTKEGLLNPLDVEVTLKFQIPSDENFMDSIYKLLRERIKDFDYKNELVQYSILTNQTRGVKYTQERLEKLEGAISLFKESLLPADDQHIETTNALGNHHIQARETYMKDN